MGTGASSHPNPLLDEAGGEKLFDSHDAEREQGEEDGSDGEGVVAWLVEQRYFLAVVGLAFLVALATYQTPETAMWVGVTFAAYSAVANDSIQTLGKPL